MRQQTRELSELEEIFLRDFIGRLKDNLSQAKRSGALSGEEDEVMVFRAVLAITAEDFGPTNNKGKAFLANLRCFI